METVLCLFCGFTAALTILLAARHQSRRIAFEELAHYIQECNRSLKIQ